MKKTFLLICASLIFGVAFTSCGEEEEDYTLNLTVTANDTIKAQNALVHLYAPVEGSFIDFYEYTDEEGRITLTLPNKAVIELVATKSPFKGCTFAEIDRDGVNVTLDMKLFNDENNGCRGNQ